MDHEVREMHNECKDLVEKVTARIKTLAQKHHDLAEELLEKIGSNWQDFPEMLK